MKRFFKSILKEGSRPYRFFAVMYKRLNRSCRLVLNRPDYAAEILHWELFLKEHISELKDPDTWKRVFPDRLRMYVRQIGLGQGLNLLELGSGPVSLLARGAYERLFTVTAVDPLASVYDRIMAGYGHFHPVRPVPGNGEDLVSAYGRDRFDIVYASNALDHVTSPLLCFRNFCSIVKPGGFIYIEGYAKVADMQGWGGMHQHNLSVSDSRLMCGGMSGRALDLSKALPVECVFSETVASSERSGGTCLIGGVNDPWFVIVFRKKTAGF